VDGLDPQPGAALEYWFWTFHAGGLAFLADFIVRRGQGAAETRISLWQDGGGRVEHAFSSTWSAEPSSVVTERGELTPQGSHGSVGDISWDLHWESGNRLVGPLPRALARHSPLDLSIEIRPDAVFTGEIRVAGVPYPVDGVPGSLTHYWGRRLADRWLWVSASRFADPAMRVEVSLSRHRLFGRVPLPLTVAFVWIARTGGEELIVSGMRGLVRHRRRGGRWEVDTISLRGRRHRLAIDAGSVAPNDLGEGITQTLLGNLVIDGVPADAGTVGVETRGWPFRFEASER
jgi:hypothetical protein